MKRGPKPVECKAAILSMMRMGQFVSLVEAAGIAGVTPQRIGQWCKDDGFDWKARREAYVQALWMRALRRVRNRAKGKPEARNMTKAQRRGQAERAVSEFMDAGGAIKTVS